jgi:hypothetical protein
MDEWFSSNMLLVILIPVSDVTFPTPTVCLFFSLRHSSRRNRPTL